MAETLYEAFAATASRMPERTVVFCGEEEATYRRILQEAEAIASALVREFQVGPGDRVAIWMPNSVAFVSALFGIWQAGGIAVPINSFYKPAEAGYVLSNSESKVLISSKETFGERVAATTAMLTPSPAVFWVQELPNIVSQSIEGYRAVQSEQPAALIYTSGTTGRPKGAMLSHGNLLANVESCRSALRLQEDDRFGLVLPMFHSFMLTVGLLLPLLSGVPTVILRSLSPLRNAMEELHRRGVSVLPVMPQFFAAMAHAPVPETHRLRCCISGSAPLPIRILQDFEAAYGVPLLEGYGLSEASPVVSVNPINGVRKVGSIGLPIPGVEVTIRDDAGKILPPYQVGELWVRGPNVMLGYWKNEEATAKALREGWLLTGDLGYLDEEGYIYITDRKKDLILVRGNNVYPREIEEWIYQFPGVKDAAVIGEPDPSRGEHPVAFIEPADPQNPPDLQALASFLRERLADYKLPRRYEIIPQHPRNATGKILKTVLREQTRPSSRESLRG